MQKDDMKYRAVLFDLGSTLINYENSTWDELGRLGCTNACPLLKDSGCSQVTPERLWNDFHTAIDQIFISHSEDLAEIDLMTVTHDILSKLGVTTLDGLPKRFVDAYYQPITNQITLIPGAAEMLRRIDEAGMKICLVSNTIFPGEYHRREMKRFGIFDHFDGMVFSSEFGYRKPKAGIYRRALELTGTKPGETIFVGDRIVEDVGGPQSIGIKGVLKHIDGRDYSAEITPYGGIKELSELENIIFG
jgi:putative hydrolase of the HAD superfamily